MITNLTAYNIDGEYFLHRGKPNARTKKKIKKRIQENKEAIERGQRTETIHCYSFVDGWKEEKKDLHKEKITNKPQEKQWQQLTLPL